MTDDYEGPRVPRGRIVRFADAPVRPSGPHAALVREVHKVLRSRLGCDIPNESEVWVERVQSADDDPEIWWEVLVEHVRLEECGTNCDRCNESDAALFTECSTCGVVDLCSQCANLHRLELDIERRSDAAILAMVDREPPLALP